MPSVFQTASPDPIKIAMDADSVNRDLPSYALNHKLHISEVSLMDQLSHRLFASNLPCEINCSDFVT